MKTIALLVVAAAFIASPAAAETKKEKAQKDFEAQQIAKQNDNTRRALRDGLPLVLPSWAVPIYFGTHMDEKAKKMN